MLPAHLQAKTVVPHTFRLRISMFIPFSAPAINDTFASDVLQRFAPAVIVVLYTLLLLSTLY
jgi:hypothetical protein